MRKLIIGVIALVFLLLGVLIIAPGLVPSDVYKSRIEAELSKSLGRDVSIDGDVKLQSLPFIRAKTSDIKIANSDQFTDENLLSVQELEARIRLLPLLSKRVEISGFDLIAPVIFLEKTKKGEVSWDFAGDRAAPKAASPSEAFKRDGRFADIDTQIAAFNLTEGQIIYRDQTINQTYELKDINGALSLKNLSSPLTANLRFSYNGESFNTQLNLDNPRQFLDGRVTPFDGRLSASFGEVSLKGGFIASEQADLTAKLNANITDLDAVKKLLPQEVPYIDLVSDITLEAAIDVTGGEARLSDIIAMAKNGVVNGDYRGELRLAETPKVDGTFNIEIARLSDLNSYLESPVPYLKAVTKFTAASGIRTQGEVYTLSALEAEFWDGLINGTYKGDATFNAAKTNPLSIDGNVAIDIAQLSDLNAILDAPLPYSDAVKKFALVSNIATQGDVYSLSGLTAEFSDGLINGTYSGDAQYNLTQSDPLSIKGKLDANITDIRKLAGLNGTELPPNTAAGVIFDTAALKGDLTGSLSALKLDSETLKFDDIEGKGTIDIALETETPFVTANLDLLGLDLRPYMASYSSQKPVGEIAPWSEAPINVAAFQAIDGVFNLSTPNVITDRIRLEQTNLNATLRDGVFKADVPKVSLYGGTGNLDITFDTSAAKPKLTFSTSLDSLQGNPFLAAIAGITQATGEAETSLSVTSTGLSQAEIMRNLNGGGGFKLIQGQIKGIDTSQFLSGLDQALTARQLPGGIGSEYATTFENIAALFKIENGVVTINDFDLSAKNIAASGGGKIDLGNQEIDFSFRPRSLGGSQNALASFGIPLKFSGGFGATSAGLDTDFLTEIVKAKAKKKATEALTERVGGPVGGLLGNVLNGGTQDGNETEGQPTTAPSSEEVITNTLGGLLGLKTPEATKDQDTKAESDKTDTGKKKTEEKPKEKSELEKALGSIFDK